MKNNFDLTNYMKSNKVGAYQQLNEMWYQDINQALGDFNTMKEVEAREPEYNKEMEEGKSTDSIEEIKFDDAIVPIKQTMQSLGYKGEYDPFVEEGYIFEKDFADGVMRISITALNDDEEKFTFTAVHFDKITKSQLFGLIKKHVIDYENGNWVSKDGDVEIVDLGTGMFSLDKPGVQDLIKKTVQRVEDKAVATKGIDEMAGDNVKSLGAGKMAHANTRVNLGRHRSSDMLDKMSKKDHKTNTVVGAKAAAYKAPHMKESEFNTVGKDLTLNDVNKDTVITPFELEKTWKDVYGEDFKTEYSGVHSYLTKNYKNFTIVDLGDVWERMYGEDFLQEYPGISRWLFSNQGKTSSKDKVAPKMNEEEANDTLMVFATKVSDEINDAYQDKFDSKKANIDQEEYTPEEMYKYISEWAESNDLTPEEAIKEFNWRHLTQELGLGLHEDTENDISNIKEDDDDIFAGSDTANWKNNYGNETSEWDTEIAGQTIKGWTAEETQGGAIAWQNPRYPNADIYATPGWEGVDGIALELHDSEDGFMDEPKIQKVVGSGTDLWKTKEGYMALMAKVFTTLEKMLKPSEEMAEDDGAGRHINHDFNDDISKDPSEFEDAIQEAAQDWNHTFEEDIMDLLDDGISKPEILTHFKDILKNANPRMEESIENEDADPFGSIKTGIDKITQGDDGDMDMSDDDRFDQLGGDKIKAGIESLMADGFDYREILQFVKDAIASKRNY